MTKEELVTVINNHKLWLSWENGARAILNEANLSWVDLSGADLSWADLSGADLRGADLRRANLRGANLRRANLSRSDLSGTDLRRANLRGADLSGADLRRVDLSGADLNGADLSGANLRGANLSGANLSWADLSGANLSGADLSEADLSGAKNIPPGLLPSHGSITGWKKCKGGVIVKLSISEKTPRSSATGRKCRAAKVTVLAVYGAKVGIAQYDGTTKYVKGKTVSVKDFDKNRFNECSTGIHFFLTRQEAEEY